MQSPFKHIAEEIRKQIDEDLAGVGLLFRVFARGKDASSLREKINKEPGKYEVNKKLVQDAIGVRVALYFSDDISIVKSILSLRYKIDMSSSTIDVPNSDQFTVNRYNLVFKLPEDNVSSFLRVIRSEPVDATFEVQLRSILSEGWHEVEHDLRYKAKENWVGQEDLSRALNGVVATLETSEWSMSKIFDELAYRHYKASNWDGMLQNKLRMRVRNNMSVAISEILSADKSIAKEVFRINRAKLINHLSKAKPRMPVTMDNIVFLWNSIGPRCPAILDITPQLIVDSARYPTE